MPSYRLAPFLLLALASACVSQPSSKGGAGENGGGGGEKAAKRAAELVQARMQLEIAELEAAAGERSSGVAVSEAQHEVDEAQLAVARFV